MTPFILYAEYSASVAIAKQLERKQRECEQADPEIAARAEAQKGNYHEQIQIR